MAIFKYIPKKYLKEYVEYGNILFRPLTYFKQYEDDKVRGDHNEGSLVFKPGEKFSITNETTNEVIEIPNAFVKFQTRTDDIYVHCLSKVNSVKLAIEFKSDCCIEIIDELKFFKRLKKQILKKYKLKISGYPKIDEVNYYLESNKPEALWAQPNLISFMKTMQYSNQQEIRIAFALNGAHEFEAVQARITTLDYLIPFHGQTKNEEIFQIGSLIDLVKVHCF